MKFGQCTASAEHCLGGFLERESENVNVMKLSASKQLIDRRHRFAWRLILS